MSKLKSIFIEVISRPAESVERMTLKRHSEVSDESRFWALSQVFFLGYHAAPRSPRKRTPAQGGGPIRTVVGIVTAEVPMSADETV